MSHISPADQREEGKHLVQVLKKEFDRVRAVLQMSVEQTKEKSTSGVPSSHLFRNR
jgi:hypothetical protein